MKILTLSNSYKEGGRCIAGIQIDEQYRIVSRNNNLSWIRPICNTVHEQVPNNLASNIKYFDVIDFEIDTTYTRNDYQSENVLIHNNNLKYYKKLKTNRRWSTLNKLYSNFNNNNTIYLNSSKFITTNQIQNLSYSLQLVKATDFEIVQNNRYDGNGTQLRILFNYKRNSYNLPITDPIFLNKYRRDDSILDYSEEIFIISSLGVAFNNKYYKLAATIFYEE